MSITPSHIIEYLYCPRFTYFEYVLSIPQYEERHFKVEKGRSVHEQKLEQNRDYLRKRIGVQAKYADQYLANQLLRGKIDEVLLLNDGTMAPLDYKFAKFEDRVYETYRTQLECYAVLIEDNFAKKVTKGFLVYTRSANKLVEVEIPDAAKNEVRSICQAVNEIITQNYFPKATKYKQRCVGCTYRNICIK
ncbi:CRISPR-associated protein Cas4 [Gaoshiqia sediminis]|uniref:CRISPR-associated exonuclease Cas4 n=1 Tax=Gaoshiqia sediminis TaxID=2986998 RepID=A0AA41YA70_9BACT|nr:CRISPR-associated protein Cas4 [Gaoshiqia sediminis]MCW0484162.1 CRISPR-associated protein Cas4 [Gaoshiqia sediminis]